MKATNLFALLFATLVAISCADAITIDTVPVGNVGNANDPADGDFETPGVQNFGSVPYAYSIGKYEVTVGQYTAFLNAVAASDSYGLYNTSMASDLNIACIARNGSSPNYTYSVIGSPNHPVTYVSWGDAARFANWLHNGQPVGGQNPSTTEDGAYTLNGAITAPRNANAIWFIPTENEWYKAAYHQAAAQGGDVDNYWNYPMRTNIVPYSDQPPGSTPDNTRVGNFYSNDFGVNGYSDGFAVTGTDKIHYSRSQNYLTDVGAYTSSPSFYGTFDQGGNVGEWNEALTGGLRGIRGGDWLLDETALQASDRSHGGIEPYEEDSELGFRVATIPEPGTVLLVAMAIEGLLLRRTRILCVQRAANALR